MSINLGGFLHKIGGTALQVAETVPGLGTAIKVGEGAASLFHHDAAPGTSAAGLTMGEKIGLGAGGAAVLTGASLLAAHELSKHKGGAKGKRRRPKFYETRHYYNGRRRPVHRRPVHRRGKKNRMPAALKRYWANKRRAA